MTNDLDATEKQVRSAFTQLVADEPPLRVDAHAAIDASRRTTRRRVVYRSTALAAVVVIATATFAAVAQDRNRGPAANTANTRPVTTPPLRLTASHGQVPVGTGGEPQSSLDAQMIAIIKANSPSGFEFKFGGGGTDPSSVDGTADDGAGPGRLYVWASGPGMLTREPCGDPEFVSGASCTETHLAGDAILSVRGLVDYQGIQTYEISLTHADGSGVGAEVGNFTLPPLPRVASSEQLRRIRPTVTRPAPIYDAAQIAAVVRAVDNAVHA